MKPSKLPEWASNDELDPITNAPNKFEPPSEIKLSGVKRGQPWLRSLINYQFNLISDWLSYFNDELDTLVLDASEAVLEAAYPVGSVYQSTVSTDPNTLFGFGTWTRIKGRVLVGLDESDTDFDGAGEEGGSKTHTHTDTLSVDGHALSINEMPSHNHSFTQENTRGSGSSGAEDGNSSYSTVNTNNTGGNDPHTHGLSGGVESASSMPPYKVVYMWERTA